MVTVYKTLVAAAAASLFLVPMTANAQYAPGSSSGSGPYQPQQPVYVQQAAPPPPQDAVAGNGQYVAPMQQQTQQTYVPQSVAMSGPRVLKDWHEGDPIPPGYHPATRARTAMIGGGAAMFGAAVPHLRAHRGGWRGARVRTTSAARSSNAAAPLFIPVIGPFITMGNTDSVTADVFLVVDGLLQAAGLGMFIYGVAVPKVVLVRNDLGKIEFHPTPIVTRDMAGLGVVGTF